jgi:hypothetical protein
MTTMTTTAVPKMRQRADLTFKQNIQHGRHGWLRLTPAYSVRLVEQVLDEFGEGARNVFEPFCGTGTTPLCASYRGLNAVATDINPFLVWLGRTKAAVYNQTDKDLFTTDVERIADAISDGPAIEAILPPIKNIERWWNPAELAFLGQLKARIQGLANAPTKELLKVAFCRTMMALSNAAFNHQSMSFKDAPTGGQLALDLEQATQRFRQQFLADAKVIADSCLDNPIGDIAIERIDARELDRNGFRDFDMVITSPPYPNRMSYIRELRPYMYWLDFLVEARAAGELDWEAIGGTWGIATSRLQSWEPTDAFVPDHLFPVLDAIRGAHPKNGPLLAAYVHKYFDDMFHHFRTIVSLVRKGGTVHYIVGNSTFYGHLVAAERLYVEQMERAGFRNVSARAIRKRNSKKELVEFHVIGTR